MTEEKGVRQKAMGVFKGLPTKLGNCHLLYLVNTADL